MTYALLGLLALSVSALLWARASTKARASRLAALLNEADDKKLAFGVFERLVRVHAEGGGSSAGWPEHERVVVLVLDTSAIIGNGGFSFLFGSELPVDPTYLLSLQALDAVGARSASAAYRSALGLFPAGSVPSDLERRRGAVSAFDEEALAAVDHAFLSAMDELPHRVAAYVRAHRRAFEEA